jgi:hypothetical protein
METLNLLVCENEVTETNMKSTITAIDFSDMVFIWREIVLNNGQ